MTATSEHPLPTETLRRLTGALSQPDLTASEAATLRRQLMSLLDGLGAMNTCRSSSARWSETR